MLRAARLPALLLGGEQYGECGAGGGGRASDFSLKEVFPPSEGPLRIYLMTRPSMVSDPIIILLNVHPSPPLTPPLTPLLTRADMLWVIHVDATIEFERKMAPFLGALNLVRWTLCPSPFLAKVFFTDHVPHTFPMFSHITHSTCRPLTSPSRRHSYPGARSPPSLTSPTSWRPGRQPRGAFSWRGMQQLQQSWRAWPPASGRQAADRRRAAGGGGGSSIRPKQRNRYRRVPSGSEDELHLLCHIVTLNPLKPPQHACI